MPMPGEERTVAHREINVFVTVQILHSGPGGAFHDERMRFIELKTGGDAKRQESFGARHGPFGRLCSQYVVHEFALRHFARGSGNIVIKTAEGGLGVHSASPEPAVTGHESTRKVSSAIGTC